MTIDEQIAAIRLDAYKDRTGIYSATRIPVWRDFVVGEAKPSAPAIHYPVTARKHISRFDYWALLSKQNYRCAICGEEKGKRALHVDHCHNSGKVRALICHGCNVAIGMIKEDSGTARAIGDYLDKHALSFRA